MDTCSIYIQNKKIILPEKTICIIVTGIMLCYVGTIFYGIDSGMSELGLIKVIALLQFLLLVEQIQYEKRIELLEQIPMIASVMAVISMISNTCMSDTNAASPAFFHGNIHFFKRQD